MSCRCRRAAALCAAASGSWTSTYGDSPSRRNERVSPVGVDDRHHELVDPGETPLEALTRPQGNRRGHRRHEPGTGRRAPPGRRRRKQPPLLERSRVGKPRARCPSSRQRVNGTKHSSRVKYVCPAAASPVRMLSGRLRAGSRLLIVKLCRNAAMSAIWPALKSNFGMPGRPAVLHHRGDRLHRSDLPARAAIAAGSGRCRRRACRRRDRTGSSRRRAPCRARRRRDPPAAAEERRRAHRRRPVRRPGPAAAR